MIEWLEYLFKTSKSNPPPNRMNHTLSRRLGVVPLLDRQLRAVFRAFPLLNLSYPSKIQIWFVNVVKFQYLQKPDGIKSRLAVSDG